MLANIPAHRLRCHHFLRHTHLRSALARLRLSQNWRASCPRQIAPLAQELELTGLISRVLPSRIQITFPSTTMPASALLNLPLNVMVPWLYAGS